MSTPESAHHVPLIASCEFAQQGTKFRGKTRAVLSLLLACRARKRLGRNACMLMPNKMEALPSNHRLSSERLSLWPQACRRYRQLPNLLQGTLAMTGHGQSPCTPTSSSLTGWGRQSWLVMAPATTLHLKAMA
jgi:hypothetical protein